MDSKSKKIKLSREEVVFINPKILVRMRLWRRYEYNIYSPTNMGLMIWELENYDSEKY